MKQALGMSATRGGKAIAGSLAPEGGLSGRGDVPDPRVTRVCAIVNPRSGSWQRSAYAHRDPVEIVSGWLAPEDPQSVKVKVMRGAKEGVTLTRQALDEGCDTVVAVGGDGTINDVIQGLCGNSSQAQGRLGLIPMGTANVLARILGFPLHDPHAASRIVSEGHTRRIDLGRANGQWFALVAGVGFDGAVTRAINPRWKRRLGRLAYVATAARVAAKYPKARITIQTEVGPPQDYDAFLVLIANGGRYAGNFRLGAQVRLDDGMLDLFVCLRSGPLLPTLVANGYALARSRLDRAVGIVHLRAREVVLSADRALPLQLDGDTVGTTPATISIVPGALEVLVPTRAIGKP
jgi:YegS/Rv2252/BmrU family lipid kinase